MPDPKIIDWKARAEQAEAERDALAAHVELLEDAALGAVRFIPSDDPTMIKISDAVDTNPATSLAHLKAQWQAEILEELIQNTSQFREANPVRGLAGSMADELRRQAKGED